MALASSGSAALPIGGTGLPVRSENHWADFTTSSVTKQICMISSSSRRRLSIVLLPFRSMTGGAIVPPVLSGSIEDDVVFFLEIGDDVVRCLRGIGPEVVHHRPDRIVPVGIGDVERVGDLS